MIARELRLRSPLDFERVRSQGRSWSTDLLVAIVAPGEPGRNRYGFAVGRRVGGAVQRNRAKRLMREAARHLHPRVKRGHDIVFIARNRMSRETTFAEVQAAMEQVLERAGLLADAADQDR